MAQLIAAIRHSFANEPNRDNDYYDDDDDDDDDDSYVIK